MDWSEIVDNPYLADLPFKIEQDQYGNIVMSPASNLHGYYQSEIVVRLRRHITGGRVIVESSVQTRLGVKVPDVVWHSDEFGVRQGNATPFGEAPEICVEVLSPSNSRAELEQKTALYFEAGAKEVWVCDQSDAVRFYSPLGQVVRSELAPDFPDKIE